MGCLNSNKEFEHRFGNIHLSGPCNMKCYFCIGQHMKGVDAYNNLDEYPLAGMHKFVDICKQEHVGEVFLTGTNTDPALYKHHERLTRFLRKNLPGVVLGFRTNGLGSMPWQLYDKGSVTVQSMDHEIGKAMTGRRQSAVMCEGNLISIADLLGPENVKINIVLGPENVEDTQNTVRAIHGMTGITRFNLREPYGQPKIGAPKWLADIQPFGTVFGNPFWDIDGAMVCHWDVHYTEVESVNLYADGSVSTDYPISRGHHPSGEVKDQSFFAGGRIAPQWNTFRV